MCFNSFLLLKTCISSLKWYLDYENLLKAAFYNFSKEVNNISVDFEKRKEPAIGFSCHNYQLLMDYFLQNHPTFKVS